jgi:hypothetical protein
MRFRNTLVFALTCGLVVSACGDKKTADDDDDDDDAGEAGSGGASGGTGGTGGATGGTGGSTGGTEGNTGGTGGTSGGTEGTTGGTGGTEGTTGGSDGSGGTTGGTEGTTGGTGGTEGTTGGTAGTGAGTGGSGGSGGTGEFPTCTALFHAGEQGYVTTPAMNGSCWQGHAYTGVQVAGSTVTPTDFESCGDPCMLCMSGSVAPDLDFRGVAWLGFNVAQAVNDTAFGTVTPTGTGIVVNFINEGGSTLRVQLGGPNADTLASDRWCVEIAGASGAVMIPYGAFNTRCWDTLGTGYTGQPIATLQLLVPGNDVDAVPFAICMAEVAEY